MSGSPVVNAAQGFTENVLQGNSPLNQDFTGGPTGSDVLSPFTAQNNPYLDATFNKAAGAVNRNLDTVLARSGRDLHGNLGARADAINDLATDIYGGAYETDRNRALSAASQMSGQIFTGGQSDLDRRLQAASGLGSQQLAAASQAIPLAREDYFDISQLGNVGATVEGMAQNIVDAPYLALERYNSGLSGVPLGQNSSSTNPLYRNPAGGMLGGMAAGAGLGGMMAAPGATGLAAVGGWPMLVGGGLLGMLGS